MIGISKDSHQRVLRNEDFLVKNDFFMEYKLDVKQPPPKLSLFAGRCCRIFIVKLTINRYYLKHYNFK
jgi:hypothetical protein